MLFMRFTPNGNKAFVTLMRDLGFDATILRSTRLVTFVFRRDKTTVTVHTVDGEGKRSRHVRRLADGEDARELACYHANLIGVDPNFLKEFKLVLRPGCAATYSVEMFADDANMRVENFVSRSTDGCC